MKHTNKLVLVERRRNWDDEHYYLDFVIDGKPLSEYLQLDLADKKISLLGWSRDEELLVKEFCLKSTPALCNARTMFLVCPECGDIGCGAITGVISEIEGEQIEWSQFGYENNYEGVTREFQNIRFRFDRADYLRQFLRLKQMAVEQPYAWYA